MTANVTINSGIESFNKSTLPQIAAEKVEGKISFTHRGILLLPKRHQDTAWKVMGFVVTNYNSLFGLAATLHVYTTIKLILKPMLYSIGGTLAGNGVRLIIKNPTLQAIAREDRIWVNIALITVGVVFNMPLFTVFSTVFLENLYVPPSD